MSHEAARVGQRLRKARLDRGLTIQEVASAAELSTAFISMVERNKTSPSIASLLRICSALGIDIGSLFQKTKAEVVRFDERRSSQIAGRGIVDFPLSPADTLGIEVLESHVEPGGTPGDELYAFVGETEFVYILEGELEFRLDGRTINLGAGDALTFSATQPHTWVNPHKSKKTRALFVISSTK